MSNFIHVSVLIISCLLLSGITSNAATINSGLFYYNDGSIAPSKFGLLSGSASSDNFTNNSKGITGVRLSFDLLPAESLSGLSLNDFEFHFGNTNIAGTWDSLTLSMPSLNIASNEATITWDSPIAKDGWLEVKYSTDQYIYFGNLVGDSNMDGFLTPSDALVIINYLNAFNSDYIYQYDINGDGFNSPSDALIIVNLLNNELGGSSLTYGPFTQVSSGPPSPIGRVPNDDGLFPFQNVTFALNYSDQNQYALVASPVPEPATMLLLSTGLVGLLGFGRKKFKR